LGSFAKTGIVLYDPDFVTTEMMVPSLETLTTNLLPLGLASPVHEPDIPSQCMEIQVAGDQGVTRNT
jgi:hypothetical protein